MNKVDDDDDSIVLANNDEAEKIYQIYMRVQAGDIAALDELFKWTEDKQICRVDELNKEYRLSHMEHVLDSEEMLENERNRQVKEWVDSVSSNVSFRFPCLNKMLYKKKKEFLFEAKNTGYENGKKKKKHNQSKFYNGKYDVSDFNELVYETAIEVFTGKTDENKCLTLDGKKNVKYPIYDGISLLKNISYYSSRKINKREKVRCLDISDMEYCGEEPGTDFSAFDKYVYKKFLESGRSASRITMYAECLEWLKRNNVHNLFKVNACNIHILIDTIMKNEDVFMKNMSGDNEIGFGMRLVKQEMLQEIIKLGYNTNIEQENISKDLEIIEQRLLDHLFYSLNCRIGKAEESKGIYDKESERFLYELDKKSFVKMFDIESYEIYEKSIYFINGDFNGNSFDHYFNVIKKYEEMIRGVASKEEGKKKYDMVNLISDNDYDLVDDKIEALLNIAYTMITFYQKREDEYRRDHFSKYKIKGLKDWDNGLWEADLKNDNLNIKLWSNKNLKKPVKRCINKERLMVYCGYRNFYFCDVESIICYSLPKERRILSRANKNHEIFMYDAG